MNLFSMAWRNVWRNSRRSAVTIAAMTLALLVELLYSGLIVGMLRGMEEDIVQIDLGDIQITTDTYFEKPSLHNLIAEPEPLLARLEEAGYPVSPRLMAGGLAAHDEFSAGVGVQGVDVERDRAVSRIHSAVARGEWIDPRDPNGVVVGTRLARTLGLDLGAELVVLSQAADGSVANDLYRVRGILGIVGGGADRGTVFMTEAAFRELMVLPRGIHKLVLRRPPGSDLSLVKSDVVGLSGAGVEVKTWKELMPVVAQMLDSMDAVVIVLYLIIYVAVAIIILNAVLMAVFERIREFGVLKAIGVGPSQVAGMIVLEGLFQAGVAVAAGLILALPCMWYLGNEGIDVGALGGMDMMGMSLPSVWRGIYDAETARTPVVLLFFIVMVAVSYPALKAARIDPAAAMQHLG